MVFAFGSWLPPPPALAQKHWFIKCASALIHDQKQSCKANFSWSASFKAFSVCHTYNTNLLAKSQSAYIPHPLICRLSSSSQASFLFSSLH